MTVGAIIQARMSSTRLPGKVLLPLLGKPMLLYTLERIARVRLVDRLVVATSVELSDDPVAEFCKKYGIACYRGSLNNVAQRFLGVIEKYNLDVLVRICADSPFMDQHIVDQAVNIFCDGDYDMVTNTLERSFPKGQSVEVVSTEAFRAAYARFSEPGDFEHVTRYFHTHKDDFKIHNFFADKNNSEIQLSVDTPEDFQMAEKIFKDMDRPHWEYGFEGILQIHSNLCGKN